MSPQQQTEDWQHQFQNTNQRLKHLLQSGLLADCTFAVGSLENARSFKAHKLLLAAASPIFEVMFFGELAEKGTISILDVKPETFKVMLEHIYIDKLVINTYSEAQELYYTADKYMLLHLKKMCAEYLIHNITPENAIIAYETAQLFIEEELKQASLQIIQYSTKEVLESDQFLEAQASTLTAIFSMDSLAIVSEQELFEAVERYTKVRDWNMENDLSLSDQIENQHATYENYSDEKRSSCACMTRGATYLQCRDLAVRSATSHIRFLTLTPKEFTEGPGKSLLLTKDEVLSIILNISSDNSYIPMPIGFSIDRRPRKNNKEFMMELKEPISETTFQFLLANISNIPCNAGRKSDTFRLYRLNWRVRMKLKVDEFEPEQRYLDISLKCWNDQKKSFTCKAEYELRIISSIPEKTVLRKDVHTFACGYFINNNVHGVDRIISCADLLSPENGYEHNGIITVEGYVRAEQPKYRYES